jgi:UDP-glucuronate decarboxylase
MGHDSGEAGPKRTADADQQRIVALTGSASRVIRLPLPVDDPTRRRPDIGRALELLGWSPKVSLDEGLERTIAWFRDEEELDEVPLIAAAE